MFHVLDTAMNSIAFPLVCIAITSILLHLLVLHFTLLAALCQHQVVDNTTLLTPVQLEREPWGNISSFKYITFHQEQIIVADWLLDCVVKYDILTTEVEAVGRECEVMREQGSLIVNQIGGIFLNVEDEDNIGIYSGDGLKISIQKELDHVSVNRPQQRHSGVSFKLT